MLRKSLAIVCLATTLFSLPVRAQNVYLLDGGAFTNALMANTLVDRMERNRRTIFGKSAQDSLAQLDRAKPTAKPVSLTFKPSPSVNMAARLASAYPPARRKEAETLFRQLLTIFNQLEQKFNQPQNDLPTAMAGFLAGSYSGYRGADFPDEQFVPLVKQMRAILAKNPEIAGASDAQKQEMYEQFAIIGVFMAGTNAALKQSPNAEIAASMRKTGGTNLQTFLNVDPAPGVFHRSWDGVNGDKITLSIGSYTRLSRIAAV
jgi:hypothetical protein